MQILTKYINLSSATANLFDQYTPTGPYLAIMVASLVGVWTARFILYSLIYNPGLTFPGVLTYDIIYELNNLNLFTEEFLSTLTPGCLNPFNPEVLNQLRAELLIGDDILLEAHLDIIVGLRFIPIEELITHINLLY